MSAPVTERPRTRTTPRGASAERASAPRGASAERASSLIPVQRVEPVVAPRRREKKDTTAAKAYARRDERLRRLVEGLQPREGTTPGRAPFVLLVMVLMAAGLVATLWLSTAATADSYVLQEARDNARSLREQSERLHREVAAMDSAPELARRAGELGMVPVQDPARLVVAPGGGITVVGTPKAAVPPPPPVVPAQPGPPPAGQTEGGPDGAPVPPDGQAAPARADVVAQGQGQQGQGQQAQGQDGAQQQRAEPARPGVSRSTQGQGRPPGRGTGRG